MLPRNYWRRGIDRNKGIGPFGPQGVGVGALWNSCMKSTWLVGKKMLVLACLQGRRLPFSPDPWDEAMCCATAMYLHMLLHGWIVCVHKRMFFFEDSACIQFVSCVSSMLQCNAVPALGSRCILAVLACNSLVRGSGVAVAWSGGQRFLLRGRM